MSIVALKRKAQRYTNHISGVNDTDSNNGFSLNGGRRNLSYVGNTNPMHAPPRTRFRDNAPMGNGGNQGNYVISVTNTGYVGCYANDPSIIKNSTKNTAGMISTKYKWMSGTYPNWWVQGIDNSRTQNEYINKLVQKNACAKTLNTETPPTVCATFTRADGKVLLTNPITKRVNVAMTNAEYVKTGYKRAHCLPTPANKMPFPFTVNNDNNCVNSYTTWEQAQAAGLLPDDYIG